VLGRSAARVSESGDFADATPVLFSGYRSNDGQRAYVERLIGTIRRKCLDQVIVVNESSLRHHLQALTDYYHRTRTHLGF
jgi:hypothetical protein